jgi:hypothetical protein
MNRLKSQLHFLHVFKDAKPQARRALLSSASEELIKFVECAINILKGNHKIYKEEKGKLSEYKNRLRALLNPKLVSKINVKV